MDPLFFWQWDTGTPAGRMTLGVTQRGLALASFASPAEIKRSRRWQGFEWFDSKRHVDPVRKQLDQYFRGRRKDFDLALDLRGTDFQRRCWNALLRIPFGETRSYADIARAVRSPEAVRAVGQANHWNPAAIVVPCHRVISSDDTLGGYGGGLSCKKWLLELEGSWLPGQMRMF